MQIDALLCVSLIIGVLFWIIPVGLLIYMALFAMGTESWLALRIGYTAGAILSFAWAFLIPYVPWQGVALAPYTAFWAGAPWHYAVIAAAPGLLFVIIAWIIRPPL